MYLYHKDDSQFTKILGRLRAMPHEPYLLIVSVSEDGRIYTSTAEACDRTQQISGFRSCGIRQEDPIVLHIARELETRYSVS